MDSLTQIVLGAAVGETVLGNKVGNKALLYGAIAGTIPDLDILARSFTDTITATEIHRGFSHSILFCVLFAPVFGFIVDRIESSKRIGWKSWSWLFFWGLITHPILDMFTTWGTQFFWPFDKAIAWNTIFVIDPLYTLPFLACTLVVLFLKKGSLSRKRTNLTGIFISTSYLLMTVLLKWNATQEFKKALDENKFNYSQISTRPAPLTTLLWNCNVDAGDAYLLADYSFFDSKPISFKSYPKNRNLEPTWKYEQSEENLRRLIDISKGWYLMEKKNGSWYLNDLRFGTMPINKDEEQFVFSYKLKEENKTLVAKENPKEPMDVTIVIYKLWNRIWGN
ncbi:membrane-bound metal-dependent hydrolase [Nonlabens tegetincola]|uniref:Membrane-bound metal-dependent hydrolase n=1 Tax=Nonlabens tegetincola TaxID=323273 RepID=A0A090Q8F4_9FLAO|nr:metal-dependent hydrolase [Nonlabens tegetincola]GAK98003.1 membrane-bound metal-dependent hydrolase [Nonlabens tegetincola]